MNRLRATSSLSAAILAAGLVVAAACTPAATGSSGLRANPGLAQLPAGSLVYTSQRSGPRAVVVDLRDGSAPFVLADDPGYDTWFARVSPDRKKILFQRTPAGTKEDYSLTSVWVVNVDGTHLRQIVPHGANGWYWLAHPEWSPDGKMIAVQAGPQDDTEIWLLSADGTNPRQLTDRAGTSGDPSWSPDGKRLAFVGCATPSCFYGDFEIFTIAASGGPATQITNDNLRDNDPYFSPDGKTLAFITYANNPGQYTTPWNVRVAAADGSSVRYLTTGTNEQDGPAQWSADGKSVVFTQQLYPFQHAGWITQQRFDGSAPVRVDIGYDGAQDYPAWVR